jgi:hypothetical protein
MMSKHPKAKGKKTMSLQETTQDRVRSRVAYRASHEFKDRESFETDAAARVLAKHDFRGIAVGKMILGKDGWRWVWTLTDGGRRAIEGLKMSNNMVKAGECLSPAAVERLRALRVIVTSSNLIVREKSASPRGTWICADCGEPFASTGQANRHVKAHRLGWWVLDGNDPHLEVP